MCTRFGDEKKKTKFTTNAALTITDFDNLKITETSMNQGVVLNPYILKEHLHTQSLKCRNMQDVTYDTVHKIKIHAKTSHQ